MMPKNPRSKHEKDTPSLRKIRRSCNKELYRTAKRLKLWIPPEKMQQAEKLYLHKVVGNLQWVIETGENRAKLCDWWEQEVCKEIAVIWDIEPERLARAFRASFGG